MNKVLTTMMLALFAAGVLSGCNTVAGAGKDLKGAGGKVETTAEKCSDGRC